ncbi:MAG: hypothetical protein H5T68_06125 [Chloroflexi bacterium]|nr:hypothetical protein [Chloroflexota bacterium]
MKKVAMAFIAILVLAAVGGGAFYAGTKVGENRVLQNPARFFQQRARGQGGQFFTPSQTPQPGQRVAQGMGGGITGTIEEINGTTVIINTGQDTIRVQTTDTTLIEKYMAVTVGDLQVGERVIVMGSKNDDGSYTARSIQSLRAFPSTTPGQ